MHNTGTINHTASTGFMGWVRQLAIPAFGFIIFLLRHYSQSPVLLLVSLAALIVAVLSAVHHAEVISHRIGEPFGALVLAVAVTVIEASIILSLMLTGGEQVSVLARDTVFAAIMIIMTGMTGLTLLIGGIKYREQEFPAHGISSALTVLVTISVLTLILPNFTEAIPGPYYSRLQLVFVATITLVLYGGFLFVQNFRHRSHFVTAEELAGTGIARPDKKTTLLSAVLLPVNLVVVVLLAESMAPDLERFIHAIGAPVSLAGIIIACVILLPEGITAIKAAQRNHIQKSLNLSLGSALASISLTIPLVALFSVATHTPLALGIEPESTIIFMLALLVLILSLSKGRTNILHGMVLLVLFVVYLFITMVP